MKPSELLEIALEDLRKCEEDPAYGVDMEDWIQHRDGVCYVCLGGAVLAKTLRAPVESIPTGWLNNVLALNCFRQGLVRRGLHFLGYKSSAWADMYVCPYNKNRNRFYEDMNNLLTLLRILES